jgi:hypothetical protein
LFPSLGGIAIQKSIVTEDPKISRARHLRWRAANPEKWRRMRIAQKKRYYAATRKRNRRRFKKWTVEEDRQIFAKRRPSDRELSSALGRSMKAIHARRLKLRKIRKAKRKPL